MFKIAVTLTQIKHLLRKHKNLKMNGVAFLAIFGFFYYFIREPAYEGKTVTQWIEEGKLDFQRHRVDLETITYPEELENKMALISRPFFLSDGLKSEM